MAMDSRTALVEDLMERFPHVPREAVFKEDLLRGGGAHLDENHVCQDHQREDREESQRQRREAE